MSEVPSELSKSTVWVLPDLDDDGEPGLDELDQVTAAAVLDPDVESASEVPA